jgi:hypothetical protein
MLTNDLVEMEAVGGIMKSYWYDGVKSYEWFGDEDAS